MVTKERKARCKDPMIPILAMIRAIFFASAFAQKLHQVIEVLALAPNASVADIGADTFLPARGAQLSVNGEGATAKVFMQDRFGKPASSRCLAWSDQAVLAQS